MTVDVLANVRCRRLRIVVENTSGVWRYVAKIVPYGKSEGGGFAIIPSFQGKNGHICKLKSTDTFSHLIQASPLKMFDGHTISHRVKLSFHSDGVTQISGADSTKSVTSGLHPSGTFKGMGILGHSFNQPVFSGGVFSIIMWGLEYYPKFLGERDTIRFFRTHLGKRGFVSGSAIALTGYLIKRSEEVKIIRDESGDMVETNRWNGYTGRRENMKLHVCNLQNQHSYLAVDCTRIGKIKADRNPSGYMLSSQRDKSDTAIQVFFPTPRKSKAFATLNRGLLKPRLVKPLG